MNALLFEDFRLSSAHGTHHPPAPDGLLELSEMLMGGILFFVGVSIALLIAHSRRRIRQALLLFAVFSSFYLVTILISIAYGIFAYQIQSVFLLAISLGIYISVNIVFLFWYWYADYPSQVQHLQHPESPIQIAFPGNGAATSKAGLPSFFDYLYLTIMVSNTFGPPENHSACGTKVKLLQMIHSVIMLVLLAIFLSRAINTLA
ncbi:MAG: hypothetical protein ACK6BG_11495 [Cyanobacteriota bacterium]